MPSISGLMLKTISKLYKQHAEIIFTRASTLDELNEALASIEHAIALYNSDSISENIADRFNDAETFKFWFDDRTRTRTDMASLRSDIKSLMNSRALYDGVRQVHSEMEKDIRQIKYDMIQEKQRTIESMALFTAIIALILSNVQVLSQEKEWWHILIVNGSLLIALTWIMCLVWMIGRSKNK